MKLISLNTWGGKTGDRLWDFIEKKSEKTDIFCLQEVFRSTHQKAIEKNVNNLDVLKNILIDFNYYYTPTFYNNYFSTPTDFPLAFGKATFVRKNIQILDKGEIFVHRSENDIGPAFSYDPEKRNDFPNDFQWLILKKTKKFLVINLHGLWEPAPKIDNPKRYKQSLMILNFLNKHRIPKILVGDFNMRIDIRALRMLEQNMINLIKSNNISTTRSSLYDKKFREIDKFADYTLVSKSVRVGRFEVLKDEVSDHLPMCLEFDLPTGRTGV